MTRGKRICLWSFIGFLAVIAALVVFIATFDWNRLKPTINDKVSAELGRPFAINGDLQVFWRTEPEEGGWRGYVPWPHFSAADITLANPAWARQDALGELCQPGESRVPPRPATAAVADGEDPADRPDPPQCGPAAPGRWPRNLDLRAAEEG